MQARLVNIGCGTIIAVDRIIAVVAPESAPITYSPRGKRVKELN